MPFEVHVLCLVVLLFAIAHGTNSAKTIIPVDLNDGGLQQYQPLTLTENDLEALLQVNCSGTDTTLSMLYVSKSMYDNCTTTPDSDADDLPSNQIQCPDSSDNTVVEYSITIRPRLGGIVPFQVGETTYFAFFEGDSMDNAPCVEGLKIAVHIQDPTTVTTPTPTTTIATSSTSIGSTTTITTGVANTSTSIVSTGTTTVISTTRTTSASTSLIRNPVPDRTTTSSRSDCTTVTVNGADIADANPRPTADVVVLCTNEPTTAPITSGASPMVWASLLPLLAAVTAIIINHCST